MRAWIGEEKRGGGKAWAAAFAASVFLFFSGATLAAPVVIDLAGGDEDVLIYGAEAGDSMTSTGLSGFSNLVTADVNGDGIQDILTVAAMADGPENARDGGGEAYIFYGKPDLAGTRDVAGTEGAVPDVVIYGANIQDRLGAYGRLLNGDVNGDGIQDLILRSVYGDGPADARYNCGEMVVIYGSATLPATIDLANGEQDVIIYGAESQDQLGYAGGSAVADVNGDGITDILAGAYMADGPENGRSNAGEVYVVYGSDSLPAAIDLAANEQDVIIYGATAGDMLKLADKDPFGDLNGDGIADIVVGALNADGSDDTVSSKGEVCVIYGGGSLPAVIDLAAGAQDVIVYGASMYDGLGDSGKVIVKDVNGDGLDDLLMASTGADGPAEGRNAAGEAYIVYGSTSLPAVIDLENGEQNVIIYAATPMDQLCRYGSWAAGDVNNDGINDILLGTSYGDGPEEARPDAGEVYIIYGSASLAATIDLAAGDEDVILYGAEGGDSLDTEESISLGDVNGDGIKDILLSAYPADGPENAREWGGEVYVVYGSASLPGTIDIVLDEEDMVIYGATASDFLSNGGAMRAEDVNGDGIKDILLGAYLADGPAEGRSGAGEIYVVFGSGAFASATAKNRDHAGKNLAHDYGTARAAVEFTSGGNASATTVTLTRNKDALTLSDPDAAAGAYWTVTSDRTGFSADVTFQYLASEVSGLTETNLKLFSCATVDGPFQEVAGAVVDTDKNTVTVSGLSGFSVFLLMEAVPGEEPPCFIGTVGPNWWSRFSLLLPGLR